MYRVKNKKCEKRIARKEAIENFVVSKCLEMLNDDNIATIATAVVGECRKGKNNLAEKSMSKELAEARKALENLILAIEKSGVISDIISERIAEREAEIKDLEERIEKEKRSYVGITEEQIQNYLAEIKTRCLNDKKSEKAIVNLFVERVVLYDESATIYFKTTQKYIEVPYDELMFIEGRLNNGDITYNFVSFYVMISPP